MSIQDAIRAANAAMGRAIPQAVVTVSIGGTTGTGYRDSITEPTNLDAMGVTDIATSRLFLNRSTWATKPSRSGDLLVEGVACVVVDVQTDAAESLWVIEYKEQS